MIIRADSNDGAIQLVALTDVAALFVHPEFAPVTHRRVEVTLKGGRSYMIGYPAENLDHLIATFVSLNEPKEATSSRTLAILEIEEFLRQYCQVDPGYSAPATQLYLVYRDWCFQGDREELGRHNFERLLRSAGFLLGRLSTPGPAVGPVWNGLRLKPYADEARGEYLVTMTRACLEADCSLAEAIRQVDRWNEAQCAPPLHPNDIKVIVTQLYDMANVNEELDNS